MVCLISWMPHFGEDNQHAVRTLSSMEIYVARELQHQEGDAPTSGSSQFQSSLHTTEALADLSLYNLMSNWSQI